MSHRLASDAVRNLRPWRGTSRTGPPGIKALQRNAGPETIVLAAKGIEVGAAITLAAARSLSATTRSSRSRKQASDSGLLISGSPTPADACSLSYRGMGSSHSA